MRRVFVALFPVLVPVLFALTLASQSGPGSQPKIAVKNSPPDAALHSAIDLPVRKVVLYKNGVGYFEHAGTVNGDERVKIDFTSSQLNDVLQSLTVLDQGGGHIAGVNYNSTMPLAEQLKTLSIGLKDKTTFSEFFNAVRGARVEVRSGSGAFTGHIMDIESHKTGVGKNEDGMTERRFLTVVSDAGEVRIFEVTPSLDVRLVDAGVNGDVSRYLELLASAHSTGLRHLTLDALGQGRRELEVSYISAVPVWKSTYRIVFPRDANGNATVQGWAVVDNTVGADWDNVQLSLVAGAPQSFIQPLSQPIYTHRPEIPIATAQQTIPQTHEAMENRMVKDQVLPMASQAVGVAGMEGLGGSASGAGVLGSIFGSGSGRGSGGGIYRATDAIQPGDVSANAFDDFFEYALTQPVTIHKNESAMVSILNENLPAEHVTLWSDRDSVPLRAVWLENKSKLTLDAGSFSLFENGEFAGEGLLDPIHPGEKRLLSYAVDQAVKVHRGGFVETRVLHHVAMRQGVLVETTSEVTESTYTVANAADEARTVIVEHTRRPGAKLDSDLKPAETTATAYRFRVAVEPHQSVDLHVGERTTLSETVRINPENDREAFLVSLTRYSPQLEQKLRPLIDAETALSDLYGKILQAAQNEKTLEDDEARDRDNLTALKGNDAAKRFVDELNSTEDAIEVARKEQAELEKQRDAARARLESVLAQLSFETDLDVTTQGPLDGDRPPAGLE